MIKILYSMPILGLHSVNPLADSLVRESLSKLRYSRTILSSRASHKDKMASQQNALSA